MFLNKNLNEETLAIRNQAGPNPLPVPLVQMQQQSAQGRLQTDGLAVGGHCGQKVVDSLLKQCLHLGMVQTGVFHVLGVAQD